MKKLVPIRFILMTCLLISSVGLQAQIWKKVASKVKQTLSDEAVDKTVEMTDKISPRSASSQSATKDAANGSMGNKTNGDGAGGASMDTVAAATAGMTSYKNYDFVPGDSVLFASSLTDEKVGEIPAHMRLVRGQMDVQNVDSTKAIHIPTGDGATMTPRMTRDNYMPDQFTVEFDFKNEKYGVEHLSVDFGQRVYYAGSADVLPGVTLGYDGISWGDINAKVPEGLHINYDYPNQWHHIAIAVNKNQGKVYIDQYRVINDNNLHGKPGSVNIDVAGYENSYVKNIRVAAGGIDIYKKLTTNGKIIMHGIRFDVDKATLLPPSMGPINQIYDLMQKDPALNFEIDGHTDNTGTSARNLVLSQQRAEAVKTQLVKMGIPVARLSTKGFGDSKPLADNNSSEGKASNRRVEFVKQ